MDFKGLDVSELDNLRITQKFGIGLEEVARARVGLVLSGRTDLQDLLPVFVDETNPDAWCGLESAQVTVAGNLALLQNISLQPLPEHLQAAANTVNSGLEAIEEGERRAAKRANQSR